MEDQNERCEGKRFIVVDGIGGVGSQHINKEANWNIRQAAKENLLVDTSKEKTEYYREILRGISTKRELDTLKGVAFQDRSIRLTETF